MTDSLETKTAPGGPATSPTMFATARAVRQLLNSHRQRTGTRDLDSANAADPAERLKFLNAQLAAAQAHKLELQNSLTAIDENSKRLSQRLESLNREATVKFNETVRSLRLPMEHQTGKRVMYIIVRYGSVYPCRNPDLSRNDNSINWTSTLTSETANPIRGKGIDLARNPRELETYFAGQSKDSVYMA